MKPITEFHMSWTIEGSGEELEEMIQTLKDQLDPNLPKPKMVRIFKETVNGY